MTAPQELRTAAARFRARSEPWAPDIARWLERVAGNWPAHVVHTSTRQAALERQDALAAARSINGIKEVA
ncbi:hypothetical protein [Spirillospora sp. NBC_01491]|uniref:hypothetical protein n=1 Tax=Spirillospora sp. NBC_01491 TaxID=2976007 RepID=UPI002E2F2998|nr:hypothetical protein [Spirillospora sp. NBC_01491]